MKKDFIKNNIQKEKLLKKFLSKNDLEIDDKIMTVKITKKIDKIRFNQAFNKLLNK